MQEFSGSRLYQVVYIMNDDRPSKGVFSAPRKIMHMDAGYGVQSIPTENSPKSKDIW